MARVANIAASSPGPTPPNQALSRMAGKKSGVTSTLVCSRKVAASEVATNKTDSPYLFITDGMRHAEPFNSVIPCLRLTLQNASLLTCLLRYSILEFNRKREL